MYRRKPQGWLKHIDFLLLDIVSLLLSFAVSLFARHGLDTFTLGTRYLSFFLFYLLAVVLLHIVNNTFSGVLRRGYYKEFVSTLNHVALAELMAIAYLFVLQIGNYLSRVVVGLIAISYALISYCIRVIWKWFLRKRGRPAAPASLYLVTTKDLAENTADTLFANSTGEYQILGMCLLDADCIGEVIANIPVTSNKDTILDFLRDKWVDEVYIALPVQSRQRSFAD